MRPMRILIVEDDAVHRRLLAEFARRGRPGVQIATAGNREDFLKALREQSFDCVLLDFYLADAEADKLIRALRDEGQTCPVIVVSGSRAQEVVIRSLRCGGVDFLHKEDALNPKLLWERIDAVVSVHRSEQCERRIAERRLKQLADLVEKDPLTGLANRRAVDRLLGNEGRSTYDRRGQVSVVMLDLDHFKQINDRLGHPCGDQVLRSVAEAIREHATPGDIPVRWGGEEFMILKNEAPLACGVHWAETLRRAIEKLDIRFEDNTIPITASLGVVALPSRELCPDTLWKADEALYLAKSRGRNRVCTWEMVAFDRLAQQAHGTTPEGRRLGVIMSGWDLLGPTQREHLTDHSDRVAASAVKLGRTLGLETPQLDALRLAGLCHDLGKFCIPEPILAKPGRLTQEEGFLVSRRASDGAEMTAEVGGDAATIDYVRNQGRRFDDRRPIEGAEGSVPLGARVLNVADAFVTMTSQRPYKPTRSPKAALREVDHECGRQFDPTVVAALRKCYT